MAQTFDTQLKNVAAQYVKQLQVKITRTTIQKDVEENPYYPSLLSLHETFNRYQISSKAYKLTIQDIKSISAPFVALVNMPHNGNDFILVTEINTGLVKYIYNGDKQNVMRFADFSKRFKNVVWFAEASEASGESSYDIKLKKQKFQNYVTAVWIALGVIILFNITWLNFPIIGASQLITILVIMLGGLSISCLLLVYDINRNNPFVKNICTIGKKTNCDAILSSKAAKIGHVSWAEIGFLYFGALTIFLLWPGIDFTIKKQICASASMLASPYIIFSIYYQWKIAKQWCPMCIGIQIILASQLLWSISSYWQQPVFTNFDPKLISVLSTCFLIPLVAWFVLKPSLISAKDYHVYYAAYKRLQYNPDTFKAILEKQKHIADGWQNLGITIGNPNADNIIVKVCNPYCGPCASAHPILDELVELNDNICVKIIFSATGNQNDRRSIVAKHLLTIYKSDPVNTKKALDDWYSAETKDYAVFAEKHPIKESLDLKSSHLDEMYEWTIKAGISYTPTIFFNGHMLPENYSLEDLKLIL